MSQGVLLNPARSPWIWCERPPVPTMATLMSSGKLSMALRSERPSLKQRRAEGIGSCSTPTCSGTMAPGHSFSCGHSNDSGEKQP